MMIRMRAVVGVWVRDRCRMCVGGGNDGVDVGIREGGVQVDSNFVAQTMGGYWSGLSQWGSLGLVGKIGGPGSPVSKMLS